MKQKMKKISVTIPEHLYLYCKDNGHRPSNLLIDRINAQRYYEQMYESKEQKVNE